MKPHPGYTSSGQPVIPDSTGPDAVRRFPDDNLVQEDLDKMRPAYWEKTWWRRLYVTVRWWWTVRKARAAEMKFARQQLEWTPEQRQAYINDGELPRQ